MARIAARDAAANSRLSAGLWIMVEIGAFVPILVWALWFSDPRPLIAFGLSTLINMKQAVYTNHMHRADGWLNGRMGYLMDGPLDDGP